MTSNIINDASKRRDFVLLFDVENGNPNGDPDAGNLPRVDPETMHGLVTDVCIKRKVRNYVDANKSGQERFRIYIQSKTALNTLHQEAYDALGLKSTGTKQKREDSAKANEWMCKYFYDVRTFGAVMSTGVNCGQVRGPIQLTFATSIDPVTPLDLSITRIAITKPEDMRYVEGEEQEDKKGKGKQTEMARKPMVPYGLYRGYGFSSPLLGAKTGFDDEDLALFWEALQQMWDHDHSASRGMMALRGLYIFTHSNGHGKHPAHKLFEAIEVKKKAGVEVPRDFSKYEVVIHKDRIPENVQLTSLVG